MCKITFKDIENALEEVFEENPINIEYIGGNLYKVDNSLICNKDILTEILK